MCQLRLKPLVEHDIDDQRCTATEGTAKVGFNLMLATMDTREAYIV